MGSWRDQVPESERNPETIQGARKMAAMMTTISVINENGGGIASALERI
jgi:hypothetical protein